MLLNNFEHHKTELCILRIWKYQVLATPAWLPRPFKAHCQSFTPLLSDWADLLSS